jgi:hypothetical protein
MISKIRFRYSWIYDENWKRWIKSYEIKSSWIKKPWPSEQKILSYISSVQKIWDRQESKILKELSLTSGLKWKSKFIDCYVVGRCIPFSDPLTVGLRKNKDDFIDTLIHELIHQLFSQKGNFKKASKAWKYLFKKYKKELRTTKIHIPLHAIHAHIFNKFFSKKRLEFEIKSMSKSPAYKRSWETVGSEGYKNIIKEFRSRIKS